MYYDNLYVSATHMAYFRAVRGMNDWICHLNNFCIIFSSFSLCVVSQNVAKCVAGRCRGLLYINNILLVCIVSVTVIVVYRLIN